MKLCEVGLENFRGYGSRTVLRVDDLTVLIGKNDAGKSTFLEALDVALGGAKVDASDIHVRASGGEEMAIECAFGELPASLTLDDTSVTSLEAEHLLDEQGLLRLRWTYSIGGAPPSRQLGKQVVRLVAKHPTRAEHRDLLSKKNAELKKLVRDEGIEDRCDLTNNASMRSALREKLAEAGAIELSVQTLDLSKEDGKSILEQLKAQLPIYALFRADRPSTDQDAEVQDPMKVAIRSALDELSEEIEQLKSRVRDKALTVAQSTLTMLSDFDPALGRSLRPEFADPKLDSVFKLSLLGDDDIAVNKRGSGVRRLVLFSFFRAEAERRQGDANGRGVIYAVEEPETAQHPDFQRMVVTSLHRLSEAAGCQVIATTHSPGLAGLMPAASLRMVRAETTGRSVSQGDDALEVAVKALGVIPDHRVRVLVHVEGPHDRRFLQHVSRTYREKHPDLVCLATSPEIAFVLLGGSTLAEWVSEKLLAGLRIPEFHLYDGDVSKYEKHVNEVNARGTHDSARRTQRLELENYLHPRAIERVLQAPAGRPLQVNFGRDDNVENTVAVAIPDHAGKARKTLDRRSLKSWLNDDVAKAMTLEELEQADADGEVLGWLREITALVDKAKKATLQPAPGP